MAPPARRLVAVAAGLVPTGERARYGEEWGSELHDLAASGAGRRQQQAYAVRLLVRAVPLRVAVLAPRRGKASRDRDCPGWAAGALAGLSVRDLAGVLAVTLIAVVTLCWVLRDEERSRRLTEIIGAWRGTSPRGAASQPAEGPPGRQRRAAAAGSGPPVLPGGGAAGTG